MTKPIRFNFETCSPGGLIALEVRLADACIERRRFREWSTRNEVPEDRAIELLLHWWGAGHDQRRRLRRLSARQCGSDILPEWRA